MCHGIAVAEVVDQRSYSNIEVGVASAVLGKVVAHLNGIADITQQPAQIVFLCGGDSGVCGAVIAIAGNGFWHLRPVVERIFRPRAVKIERHLLVTAVSPNV